MGSAAWTALFHWLWASSLGDRFPLRRGSGGSVLLLTRGTRTGHKGQIVHFANVFR